MGTRGQWGHFSAPYWQVKAMRLKPTIRKQPADSVPYGQDIARHGGCVYVAYDGDRRIAVAATSKEARELYKRARMRGAYGNPPAELPSWVDGRRDKPCRE